jgi:multimeric flavodoxin WrbA
MGTAGGATVATKTGTGASETINGTSVADALCGRGGNDVLNGLDGADRLYGETGNDTPHGGLGDDRLDGGSGVDTASYSDATGGITASLDNLGSPGDRGADTLVSIENITGGAYGECISALANSSIISNRPKILGINSSPRKENGHAAQGSSTRILLSHALEYIQDESDTEIIDLIDFEILPTTGCYSTDENLCQIGFDHYHDDLNKMLFKKIQEAEGIIFSSPTYWLEMSSRLSALFERLTELDPIVREPEKRLLQGKVAGAIATAHLDGAAGVCYDILKRANYLGFIIPPHAFAIHVMGQNNFTLQNKELLKEDFTAFRNAEVVAANVLKMCRLVKGKKDDWSVYFELVRPVSEEEFSHNFDEKKEKQRLKDGNLLDMNKMGLI